MTEDEAREKWCPFVNLTTFSDHTGTQYIYDTRGNNDGIYSCIASECMAWVWDYVWDEDQPTKVSKQNGHCGLVK